MRPPKIIREDAEAILKYIEGKVPAYTPEWTFGDDKDAGVAISKIFSYMSDLVIRRLNDAPQKHFLSFLETINTSQIPAQPARVPLTFTLSKSAFENVLIPGLSQASASGADGKPLIFETEENIMATPSNLVSALSVLDDGIFDHKVSIDGMGPTDLFGGENRQEHMLLIGDKDLLNVKNAKIVINMMGYGLGNLKNNITWEYSTGTRVIKENGKEIKKIEWQELESKLVIKGREVTVILDKNTKGNPISEAELDGYKSRWIRCRVNDSKIENVKDMELSSIAISSSPAAEIAVPIIKVQGIGPFIYSVLAKYGIEYVDELIKITPDKLAGLLVESLKEGKGSRVRNLDRYCKLKAINILEAAEKEFFDKAGEVLEQKETAGIYPDMAFSNDVPVDLDKEFYPFGNKPQVYNTFYIASEDAFSKGEYEIILTFDMFPGRPSGTSSRISNIPQLSWEYWDGKGWGLLKTEEVSENFTSYTEGTAQDVTKNSVKLDNNAPATGTFTGTKIEITGGPGEGQSRIIKSYSNRVVTVEPDWSIPLEANKSTYRVSLLCDDPAVNETTRRNITIPLMPKTEPISVNGKESYWIRVRLVCGDYGKEYEIKGDTVEQGKYCPPKIKKLIINYSPSAKDGPKVPEYILAKNNLSLKNLLDDKSIKNFKPFEHSPGTHPSLYLGFDRELRGGPISLFVSIDKNLEYPEDFMPRIRWEYLSDCKHLKWDELEILDETQGLKKSGMVKFKVPAGMTGCKIFGTETGLYWVRASITGDPFEKSPAIMKNALTGSVSEYPADRLEECRDTFDLFNGTLIRQTEGKKPPKILGFYPNSVWALQSRTIIDEIIGSSTGEHNQISRLMNTPVVREKIYVNEFNSLTEGERKSIKEVREAREIKDDKENVLEFWVRWDEVPDFIRSGGKDRHYTIDGTSGEICFGDGKHGMPPPIGQNNIKATYSTGGGKKGNLDAHRISKIQSAIDFVDKVDNPIASDGGTDTEEIDTLIERAPAVLKHRNKAVALSDFEWLAKEASREVARVKVLPNFNAEGKYETGWVTVIIVPESSEVKPTPLPELKRRVKTYLKDRSPGIITLRVIQPFYVEVIISADLITNAIESLPVIEQEAKAKIAGFLHPLTGGVEGKGWNFGSAPCISDIYSVLERIEDVDYVKNVRIRLQAEGGSKAIETTDASGGSKLPEYALLYSGEHDIAVQWERRDKFATAQTQT